MEKSSQRKIFFSCVRRIERNINKKKSWPNLQIVKKGKEVKTGSEKESVCMRNSVARDHDKSIIDPDRQKENNRV